MAKSIYRINAMIGVLDPSLDRPAHKDSRGNIKKTATKGVRMVSPGEPVELDDKEGKFYIERHGGSVEEKPVKAAKVKVEDKTDEK